MKRLSVLLWFALIVLFRSQAGLAGVQEVSVKVDGMACPFCTYNIEKRVKRLEGFSPTTKFKVSVERGEAVFAWKPDVPFDPKKLQEEIKRAGFTPGAIELKAVGTPAADSQDKSVLLVLSKTHQQIKLLSANRAGYQVRFENIKKWFTTNEKREAIVKGMVSLVCISDFNDTHFNDTQRGKQCRIEYGCGVNPAAGRNHSSLSMALYPTGR